jgi:thiamine-phosphate pyrophosphorylase
VLPRLYAVCDADVCARAGWTLADFAAACLAGGATLLQIRAKRVSSREFLATTDAIAVRAREHGATVIVNDRADIAALTGAGVHVGQDDLSPADVRALVGPDVVLGLSTHTIGQIAGAAAQPVSYLAIGPVFPTATKATGYDAVGLDMVRAAASAAAAARRDLVAIGGVTLDTAPEVIAAGATSVAVIADLLVGGDPSARVRAYVDRLGRV